MSVLTKGEIDTLLIELADALGEVSAEEVRKALADRGKTCSPSTITDAFARQVGYGKLERSQAGRYRPVATKPEATKPAATVNGSKPTAPPPAAEPSRTPVSISDEEKADAFALRLDKAITKAVTTRVEEMRASLLLAISDQVAAAVAKLRKSEEPPAAPAAPPNAVRNVLANVAEMLDNELGSDTTAGMDVGTIEVLGRASGTLRLLVALHRDGEWQVRPMTTPITPLP